MARRGVCATNWRCAYHRENTVNEFHWNWCQKTETKVIWEHFVYDYNSLALWRYLQYWWNEMFLSSIMITFNEKSILCLRSQRLHTSFLFVGIVIPAKKSAITSTALVSLKYVFSLHERWPALPPRGRKELEWTASVSHKAIHFLWSTHTLSNRHAASTAAKGESSVMHVYRCVITDR